MATSSPRNFHVGDLKELSGSILYRFHDDQCLRIAASLSYTTLLSLVPLLAISFAIFFSFSCL